MIPSEKAVHDAFRAYISNPSFPCLGARSALNRGTYSLGVYDRINEPHGTALLAADLSDFVAEQQRGSTDLTTFVAVFQGSTVSDQETLTREVWGQLRLLSAHDTMPWEPGYSPDPSDPRFSFCFGGCALFVVGLYPTSPRLARRFPWPALVFNPHHQFETIREKGHYERMTGLIRQRDIALQGTSNPVLSHFGTTSEAIQYTGQLPIDLSPFTP